MFRRCVRNEQVFIVRRLTPALLVGFLLLAVPLRGQVTLPPVTVGAGLQTSFVHTKPDLGTSTDQFCARQPVRNQAEYEHYRSSYRPSSPSRHVMRGFHGPTPFKLGSELV